VNVTLKIVSTGRRSIWERREFLSKSANFKPKIKNKSLTLQLKSNWKIRSVFIRGFFVKQLLLHLIFFYTVRYSFSSEYIIDSERILAWLIHVTANDIYKYFSAFLTYNFLIYN
jgi:hypothetical protein